MSDDFWQELTGLTLRQYLLTMAVTSVILFGCLALVRWS